MFSYMYAFFCFFFELPLNDMINMYDHPNSHGKDLYIYLHLVSINPNRQMLAALDITLRKFRASNCARKI